MCWQRASQWPQYTAVSHLPQLSTHSMDTDQLHHLAWQVTRYLNQNKPPQILLSFSCQIPPQPTFLICNCPMPFLTLQTIILHKQRLLPASRPFPLTQHHSTFFPTAILTAWLLPDHSMNYFFDYSHTYTPSLWHKYLILPSPNPLFSILGFLTNSEHSCLSSPQWRLSTHYFSSMAPIISHQILKTMLSLSPFTSISSPAFFPAV